MDVRQRYGQLVSALSQKNYLLGGQRVAHNINDSKEQIEENFEEQIFEKLGQIRAALNSVKCRVNSVCARHGIDRWHSFTSFTHPLKGLPAWVSSRVLTYFVERQQQQNQQQLEREELSNTSLLLYTQAFCKFVQLVDAHHPDLLSPFLKCQHKSPRSLHLCELPGAFVVALKHSLDPEQSNSLQWFINGLNPHWEWSALTSSTSPSPSHCSTTAAELNNDLLLLNDHNECAVAAFGWSGAGDVLPEDEWDDAFLAHRFGILPVDKADDSPNKFELVTADGGFDCAKNPSCQELLMLPLIKRQVQIALKCLRQGGSLVLKTFTFFERETVALIATLCATFGEVRCIKPPSSKPGNSEVYLLCFDFKGSSTVFDNENGNNRCPFDQILLKRILDAARSLAGHQIGFIEFNLATFRRLSQDERTIISIDKCTEVERWGARILDRIRLDQRTQMAPSSHYSWHQTWHPKNADKISRLLLAPMPNDGTFSKFAPLIFVPNCASFFTWLLSQEQQLPPYSNGITATTAENDTIDGDRRHNGGICIGNGDGKAANWAFVVFGRIEDAAQRDGTRPVDHSLFTHPNWLKRVKKVHDFCSAIPNAMDDGQNGNNTCTNEGNRRLLSKSEWLQFLIEQCQSVSSAQLSSFVLSLGRSEAILSRFSASVFVTLCCIFGHVEQTFSQEGSAKFRFSQPNSTICPPLARFLANIYSAYEARIASDHRWTLLKFLPLHFFDMPTWTTVSGRNENGDGRGVEQKLSKLGEQIAEFNSRAIALSSCADCVASPKETTDILCANDSGTTDRNNGGAPKAKRTRKCS